MARPARRRWRWLLLLGLPLGLLALLHWTLQPERLGQALLDQLSAAIGLPIRVDEPATLGYWPGLHLQLRGLQVGSAAEALLEADALAIFLPLSVLWSDLEVKSVALRRPILRLARLADLPSAAAAEGPPRPLILPSIDSLVIDDGRIEFGHGQIEALSLVLEDFRAGQTLALRGSGRWRAGTLDLPVQLELQAAVDALQPALALDLTALTVGSASAPSALSGRGQLRLQPPQQLDFDVALSLADWPVEWPALPTALQARLPGQSLRLSHRGGADLGGPIHLHSAGPLGTLDAEITLDALSAWIAAADPTAPPPFRLQAEIPALDVDGLQIEGLRIETEPALDR